MEIGRAKGLEKGRAEGIHLVNVENARKMKSDGLDFETIAKYTDLSVDEIEIL